MLVRLVDSALLVMAVQPGGYRPDPCGGRVTGLSRPSGTAGEAGALGGLDARSMLAFTGSRNDREPVSYS